tara:strand:- start:1322 stop:1993 length:672 start_codon:yes stop_codon:yes gene_type:complete
MGITNQLRRYIEIFKLEKPLISQPLKPIENDSNLYILKFDNVFTDVANLKYEGDGLFSCTIPKRKKSDGKPFEQDDLRSIENRLFIDSPNEVSIRKSAETASLGNFMDLAKPSKVYFVDVTDKVQKLQNLKDSNGNLSTVVLNVLKEEAKMDPRTSNTKKAIVNRYSTYVTNAELSQIGFSPTTKDSTRRERFFILVVELSGSVSPTTRIRISKKFNLGTVGR